MIDSQTNFTLVARDEPSIKATFSINLTVDDHLQVLSNMPELSVIHLPHHKKRVSFDRTPIMSTYIVAFAVGEFDCLSGVTRGGVVCRTFTPPGRVDQARFAQRCAIHALDFYDQYFQIKYPLPKLDQCKDLTYALTLCLFLMSFCLH